MVSVDYVTFYVSIIIIFLMFLVSAAFTERLEKDAPSLQKLHSV